MFDLKVLGTVTRSHGLKGSFKVNIHTAGFSPIEKDEPVFIQIEGGPVPFFVEDCSASSHDTWSMKLDDIDTLEQAERLVGRELLIEAQKLLGVMVDEADELIGYAVIDVEKGAIGVVTGVMETAQHPILEIDNKGTQILVPWVEAIVKDVDDGARVIKIEAPDGLIDLYMNG